MAQARGSGEKVDIEGNRNRFNSRDNIFNNVWLAVLCHSDGEVENGQTAH